MHQHTLRLGPYRRGLTAITDPVAAVVAAAEIEVGLCHVFLHHTSASLILQENADPDVGRDLEAFMTRLVPDGDRLFRHVDEGPDDMPAHVKAALTAASLTIPVTNGRLALGTWQGIFLWEHRNHPDRRTITVTVHGLAKPSGG